jgi:hypothetical protein
MLESLVDEPVEFKHIVRVARKTLEDKLHKQDTEPSPISENTPLFFESTPPFPHSILTLKPFRRQKAVN